MEQLKEFFKLFYIPFFNIGDFVEILIIIFVTYKLVTSIRNTRAWIILKGIIILAVFYLISYICSFEIIKLLFQSAITLFSIALVIVFQQDIRKILEQIGNKSFTQYFHDWKNKNKEEKPKRMSDKTISELVKGVFELGKAKTGSLIVIEKDIPLNDIVATGIDVNADISSALLINIFEKNTPLHDGAVIIKNDKIISATCYLPLSNNAEISKSLGTRHRAGIGVTEAVDCFVIISSEETGAVSYVENGKITRRVTPDELTEALKRIQEYPVSEIKIKPKKSFLENNTLIKLGSALFGVCLWFIMMTVIDPVTTVTIHDVPIEVQNEEAITSQNKTYELEGEDTVNVEVKDKSSIVKSLTKDDITATVDLSKLSFVNTVDVNVSVNNSTTEIEKVKEDVINVYLDDITYGEFPIEIQTTGKPASGYSVKEIDLSNSTIGITGGKTLIKKIDRVVAELDISNVQDGQEINFVPVIYDKNGDIIDNNQITFSINNLQAYITLEETKTIPLNIQIEETEDSAGQIKDISYEPKEIVITGEESALKDLDSLDISVPLKIEVSNIADKEVTKVINVADYLPDGVVVSGDNQKVTITVSYEPYPSKNIAIPSSNISIINQNSEYTYKIDKDSIEVIVASNNIDLNTVTSDDLRITVDVQGSITTGEFLATIENDKGLLTNSIKIPVSISKN